MIRLILRSKFLYMLYNLFQYNRLKGNLLLYRKYGIKKYYFSPISSRDFTNNKVVEPEIPAEVLQQTKLFKQASASVQEGLLSFEKNGFAVLPGWVQEQTIESINQEIDFKLSTGALKFKNKNKIMFAYRQMPLLRQMGEEAHLLELLGALMGGEVKLFQSINFLTGSEQKSHSDSIHMTTHPLGGLLGVWIALEDITEENGPLHYYPGSHKLPYYLNADYGNEGSAWWLGPKDYSEYEKMLASKLEENNIQKQLFKAQKGDLLIWHANLIHGGEPHTNKQLTRKSVVFHYFKKDSICYHEITQRPALL
jgi:phytanoyl-CoA hydroxylase